MKEYSSSSSVQKNLSREKILGTGPLQVTEDDVTSRLVGGIVEKGFSGSLKPGTIAPVSAPRPTVLPFPVARHRSHGPHWAPKKTDFSGDGDTNKDDEEAENVTEFETIAAFANPVQRKEKKGLDFSKWREVTSDSYSAPQSRKENKNNVARQAEKILLGEAIDTSKKQDVTAIENGVPVQRTSVVNVVDPTPMEVENLNQEKIQFNTKRQNESELYEKSIMREKLGSTNLESQIDAENRAHLKRMSADDIAEAQAELMNKMSPELINLLKKRGQDKIKKQESSGTDVSTSDRGVKLQDEKISFPKSDMLHKTQAVDSKDEERRVDKIDEAEMGLKSGNLWDSWSKRVEAVRDLRFSLDGDVIDDELAQVAKTGNTSSNIGYSAENVSERDYLRTEGDPAAAGYTIKEALALVRSVIPSQRSLALLLITSVLHKAICHIRQNQIDCTSKSAETDRFIDWEAIWAFALGPEPELALSLRMTLDDNHNNVVIACAKVIQCVLTCDINECFFDISEKIPIYQKDLFTAPIFRSRPKIDDGFLKGGFWKYNTKPSNILLCGEGAVDNQTEAEHTIQDDIAVAGQDFAAGLVRMGILARLRYLLETDPSDALEECVLSILISIARHSPTCVDAIMKCPRLVHTVISRFNTKDQMEINHSKIKSITLLKVLARSEKKNCVEFQKGGIFQKVTWHLYRYAFSIDRWVESGREKCKLSSALLVEQLRLWKIFIQYGYCISYFTDLFPALCIWLTIPNFEKLIEQNILVEFTAISREAYLVLNALSCRLPNFYCEHMEVDSENSETWCWSHVTPMVDLGLKWIGLKSEPYLSKCFNSNTIIHDSTLSSMLWVISAVTHMLSSMLRSSIPEDFSSPVPWLPDFVPKIGLEIIKNGFLSFSESNGTQNPAQGVGSFCEYLCLLRHQSGPETSLASVCCLHGLVEVVVSVNTLIGLANPEINTPPYKCQSPSSDDKILAEGILKYSLNEMRSVLTTFMKLVPSEMQHMQSIETFARGGPSPGVGVGWGAPGGGFWSATTLLAQVDAALIIQLLEIRQIPCIKDSPDEEVTFMMQIINCALGECLILGPRDSLTIEKVFNHLFQAPVLMSLSLFIQRFLGLHKGFKILTSEYTDEDFFIFSNILASHYKNRWLCVKKKKEKAEKGKNENSPLPRIDEELETSNSTDPNLLSLVVEWAHQRTPLPSHWFLSPISTVDSSKPDNLPCIPSTVNNTENTSEFLEVAKAGLFFLLGIESMSALFSPELYSPVQSVPLVWKFHSMSVVLFASMSILEEEKSREVYENLQQLYGQLLDRSRFPTKPIGRCEVEFLKFQSEVHESYSTFIETFVEQFAAVSFGDLVYGRQVSLYLHQCVEASVRLAAWNALSNSRALELLPPLEKCIGDVHGYLEPYEDNESILEAYVKSWVTGTLDRAAARRSVSYTMVLHHLSSFIFGNLCAGDKLSLRNKLAKSLLRDYCRKQKHEGMMMELIRYNDKTVNCGNLVAEEVLSGRFKLLKVACEGNSSLLSQVEKIESLKEKHVL